MDRAALHAEFAHTLAIRGEHEAAMRHANLAAELREPLGPTPETASIAITIARIAAKSGDLESARRHIGHARQVLAAFAPSRASSIAWRELADTLSELGLFEDANLCYQLALADAGIKSTGALRDESAKDGSARLAD